MSEKKRGRPTLANSGKGHTKVTVAFPNETKDQLAHDAESLGMTQAQFIRQLYCAYQAAKKMQGYRVEVR